VIEVEVVRTIGWSEELSRALVVREVTARSFEVVEDLMETVGASATPALPVWLAFGVLLTGDSTMAGKLLCDVLITAASSSFALSGTVETKPKRGGFIEGCVRFP